MLESDFGVLVSEGQEPGGRDGHDGKEEGRGDRVQVMDPPVEPDGDAGHDEGIAVEQRRRLGRHPSREVLQDQLVLLGRGSLGGLCFGTAHCVKF